MREGRALTPAVLNEEKRSDVHDVVNVAGLRRPFVRHEEHRKVKASRRMLME